MPIDPHRGREFDLMIRGQKKLALLFAYDERFKIFVIEPYPAEGKTLADGVRYLVYRFKDAYLARAFKRADLLYRKNKISRVSCHIRRGILLGYSKNETAGYSCGRGKHEEPF